MGTVAIGDDNSRRVCESNGRAASAVAAREGSVTPARANGEEKLGMHIAVSTYAFHMHGFLRPFQLFICEGFREISVRYARAHILCFFFLITCFVMPHGAVVRADASHKE